MDYKPAKLNDGNNDLGEDWFVYYFFKHPESGKLVRFRVYISNKLKTKFARREKAHEIIKEINSKLIQGWSPFTYNGQRMASINDAIAFAISIKSTTLGLRSRHTYASVARLFLRFLETRKQLAKPISELNYRIIQDYFDNSLIVEKISPVTYNNRLTALRTIFNVLKKRDYLDFNPMDKIETIQEPEAPLSAFTPDELKLISKELPEFDYNLYVVSQLIFYCFIRPAELVRLQFRDILWDNGLIIIPGGKSKNKRSETVILPDQLKMNLSDWKRDYPDDWFLFAFHLKPGKKEIAPTRIAEAWKKFAEKFNLQKGIYQLKHTGNGMAFDLGMNARDIQLQNRHSSLEQTQQYLNKFRRTAGEKLRADFKGF